MDKKHALKHPAPVRIRRKLLAWFKSSCRDLPWRKSRDPYAIWVSEIMLQQTQVTTVIPYFKRFLAALPTIESLAQADEQLVLRLWEGLGYYRRARFLHRAARIIVEKHAGHLPEDPELVAQLPGFAKYTVGAVQSQAYDLRLPILEANSKRLLSRLVGIEGELRNSEVQKELWNAAESLLPQKRVGDFNQALMELGALVCTPTNPSCHECPVSRECYAFNENRQADIPSPSTPPKLELVREVAIVVRREQKVLLAQRKDSGRWPNMWEFPHAPVAEGCEYETTGLSLLHELTNIRAERPTHLLTLQHGVTRFRITLTCLEASFLSGAFASKVYQTGRWVPLTKLADYPVSSPQRRLAKTLMSDRQPTLF